MNRLLEIGFETAGHWVVENGQLKYELLRHTTQRNILYSFVCDGEIKYLGKTVRTLKARMGGYRNPGSTQSTNIRINQRIRELLASGGAVDILALPDNGLHHYGQFHLNLAAGLEDALIRVIDPPWNGGLKESIESSESPEPINEDHPPIVGIFGFTLQPTYFNAGFFNVGVADESLIAGDGEKIEISFSEDEQPILATVNRRANSNGTPRIMGGAGLRDWFRSRATVKDAIHVDVFAATRIRLRVIAPPD